MSAQLMDASAGHGTCPRVILEGPCTSRAGSSESISMAACSAVSTEYQCVNSMNAGALTGEDGEWPEHEHADAFTRLSESSTACLVAT